MTHQAIICSYPKDYEWLIHCLVSLRKFARGYLPPVVCVDVQDEEMARRIVAGHYPEASVAVKPGRPGQGFMRAQIAMMEADLFCPAADIIHFIGSDCIATRPFDASIYDAPDGRPAVLYTPYAQLPPSIPWRPGTERILGHPVEFEFMRRLPSVFPRSIFAPMRAHVERVHGKPFNDYIHEGNLARRDTSEANVLGAFAYYHLPETCHWVSTASFNPAEWPTALGQHWSHGGLDRPSDACYEYDFRGQRRNAFGQTPRSLIDQIVYDRG